MTNWKFHFPLGFSNFIKLDLLEYVHIRYILSLFEEGEFRKHLYVHKEFLVCLIYIGEWAGNEEFMNDWFTGILESWIYLVAYVFYKNLFKNYIKQLEKFFVEF